MRWGRAEATGRHRLPSVQHELGTCEAELNTGTDSVTGGG